MTYFPDFFGWVVPESLKIPMVIKKYRAFLLKKTGAIRTLKLYLYLGLIVEKYRLWCPRDRIRPAS